MALAYHYEAALAVNDSEGTDGGNTVGGAVVTAFSTSGDAAIMYDDESGSNGSTAKQTKTSGTEVGTVEFWIEEGTYDIYMNGVYKRRVTVGNKGLTTEQLINSASNYQTGDTVTTTGFSTAGDGGGAQWVASSTTGLAPSQTPSSRGSAELVDGSGRLWELAFTDAIIDLSMGVKNDNSTDDSQAWQACFNAADGGETEFSTSGLTVIKSPGISIAEGLSIPDKVNLVGGSYKNCIIKLKANSEKYLIATEEYVDNTSSSDWGQHFRGVTLDGNKASAPLGGPCLVLKSYRPLVESCQIYRSASHGILCTRYSEDGTGPSTGGGIAIRGKNIIKNNDGAGIYIEGESSPTDSYITDNIIHNNGNGVAGSYNIECAPDALAPGWRIMGNQMFKGWIGNIYWRQAVSGGINDNTLAHEPAVLDSDPSYTGELVNVHVAYGPAGGYTINDNVFPFKETSTDPTYVHLKIEPLYAETVNPGIIYQGNSFACTESGLSLTTVSCSAGSEYKIIDGGNTYQGYAVETFDDGVKKTIPYSAEFTPTVSFATAGDFSPTYNNQRGYYVAQGDEIRFWVDVDFDCNSFTTATGRFEISGLPKTSSMTGVFYIPATLGAMENVDFNPDNNLAACVINGESKICVLRSIDDGLVSTLNQGEIKSGKSGVRFAISGSYIF